MPQSTQSNAVVFTEGPGHFLISALPHGFKAHSYLTRTVSPSSSVPELLVRKKLNPAFSLLVPHSDNIFATIAHPSIAPRLISSTPYLQVSDALYFAFCNGGDLRQFINLHTASNTPIPEAFIWWWLKSTVVMLANLHYSPDERGAVDPLIHRDIWQGNFFLHWPQADNADNAEMPEIYLGDFGSAQYVSDGDVGRGPTVSGMTSIA